MIAYKVEQLFDSVLAYHRVNRITTHVESNRHPKKDKECTASLKIFIQQIDDDPVSEFEFTKH